MSDEGVQRIMNDDIDERVQALCAHFDCKPEDVTEEGDGAIYGCGTTYTIESEPGEYAVLTDEEANEAWDAALDSYLDDCLLCELPAIAQQYFDRDAWKRDARHDGRGHSLSTYDGDENEQKIGETWYYIYRVN